MEIKYQITAIAPTVYQLNSLGRFHLSNRGKSIGGQYYGWTEFYTLEEAKMYLISIAENYFDDSLELQEEINCINDYGNLTIDGVTAIIEEIEEDF
jgi:hypothetical protein